MQPFLDSLSELNIFIILLILIGFFVLVFSKITVQKCVYFLGFSYILVLFDILFLLRNNGISGLELSPFHTIFEFFNEKSHIMPSILVYNILSNILIFLPIGIFLPIFFATFSHKKIIIIGISIVFFAEFFQFLLGVIFENFWRITDIDDVIFWILGFLIGFFLFLFCKKYNFFQRFFKNKTP